jgi:hypothetical protein
MYEGTTCAPVNPDDDGECYDPRYDQAACCNADASCSVGLWEECTGAGQAWGYAGTCSPNPCPGGGPDPEGACCAPDGSCTFTTEAQCADDWLGEGTDCDPNPCPQPGACCTFQGDCTVTFEDDCTGTSEWQGAGTDCDPNPCIPLGICCLPAEPYDQCMISTAADCTEGWIWDPNYTECSPDACHEIPTETTSWGKLKTLYR